MTEQETAMLLLTCSNWWRNIMRGSEPEEMTKAWASALKDVPFAAAKSAAAHLAETMTFPPTVAEIRKASAQFMPKKIESFEVLFSRTCHECLHFDTPLFQKMQRGEINQKEALTLNVKV